MKIRLLSLVLLVSCTGCSTPSQKPVKDSFVADNLTIYRDFLQSYTDGSKSPLNIAEVTVPFQPDNTDRWRCLRRFHDSDLGSTSVHTFAASAFPPPNRLVDPNNHRLSDPWKGIQRGQSVDGAVDNGFAAALFTFSEIVFDSSRTHAALSYSFVCGSLCGNGAIILYEKQNGTWKRSKGRCGEWVS